MKIQKIEIRNFRNLRDIEVYPAHTTIFIGENNAGKSNLLYALRLLLDPEAKRLKSEISEEDINDLAKDVTNLLSPHIPSGQSEVSIAVATEDPSQLVKGLRLNLKRQSDYRAYDMSRHGTGLQNLVLIAMFRHRISTAGVIQPILAIEEPEAHLHPQAQRCLLKDLEKIDGPVLLTTHSPGIVECSDPLGLICLTSTDQNQFSGFMGNRTWTCYHRTCT